MLDVIAWCILVFTKLILNLLRLLECIRAFANFGFTEYREAAF